jgi:hypothetical protein
MLTRSITTSVIGRSTAIRRQRRRSAAVRRLYCATNGCASFLDLDPETGIAACPICGFTRRFD